MMTPGRPSGGALVATDGTTSDAVRPVARLHEDLQRLPGHQRRLDRPRQRPSDGLDVHRIPARKRRADRPDKPERPDRPAAPHPRDRLRDDDRRSGVDGARTRWHPGFTAERQAYAAGWHQYLATLKPVPRSAAQSATEYHVSQMVLAASEDKTYRGGFVAAPGRPWAWANVLQSLAVYHAVWSRDLYEIATALIAMGDPAAANRALDYLFNVQQKPDGSYPQNSRLSGEPVFGGLQMDEVSFPTVLAGQLGRTGAADWAHVKKAEDFVVANGPSTPGERWENASGYSPATIAAEIAGLVVGADIARKNGDNATRRSLPAGRRFVAGQPRAMDRHHQRPI